ncbi:MAG: conjugal transfer protein TrbL family protein [Bacillota bacterium]
MLSFLQNASSAIIMEILRWLVQAILAPLDWLLKIFADAGALRDLTTAPWAQTLIGGAQGLAGGILAVRVTWEALQMASLRAEGAPTVPGSLLKRTAMTAAAIAAGPWLAREMIVLGNELAAAVGGIGLRQGLNQLDLASLAQNATSQHATWMLLMVAAGVILLLLILFQALVRTMEMLLAAVISPLAALGYMSGGGMADVWWREVVVLATAQAVQMLMLYVSAAVLMAPSQFDSPQVKFGPFLFLAALWVTWRTPHILRNYAYSSGVSGGVGSAVAAAGQQAVARAVLAKLPF